MALGMESNPCSCGGIIWSSRKVIQVALVGDFDRKEKETYFLV